MAELIFKRYEKKYLLSPAAYERLRERLLPELLPDIYPEQDIANLYMDTEDFLLAYRRPSYREKLRLRVYTAPALPGTPAFIELKKKLCGVSYKRRVEMPLSQAEHFLVSGVLPEDLGSHHREDAPHAPDPLQVIREIAYTISHYHLTPRVVTAYHRQAFILRDAPEVRVTFDLGLRYRTTDLSLTLGSHGTSLIDPATAVMEIKTPDALPCALTRILAEEGVFASSFSKYGAAYAAERSKKC